MSVVENGAAYAYGWISGVMADRASGVVGRSVVRTPATSYDPQETPLPFAELH